MKPGHKVAYAILIGGLMMLKINYDDMGEWDEMHDEISKETIGITKQDNAYDYRNYLLDYFGL